MSSSLSPKSAGCMEWIGEIKDHDPHSDSRLFQVRSVQGEDDAIVHADAKLIGKPDPQEGGDGQGPAAPVFSSGVKSEQLICSC